MRRGLLIVIPVVVIGVVAALVSIKDREADAQFILRQQHPVTVEPREVEIIVAKAHEPVAGGHGAASTSARCRPGSSGERGNPWSCTVHYASGDTFVYAIQVKPDGSLSGSDPTGQRVIEGCCVAAVTAGTD